MTRKELEAKLFFLTDLLSERIRSAPIPSFLAGIIIGILVATFKAFVGWLLFLCVAALLVVWLMSEPGNKNGQTDIVDGNQSGPGGASGSK